MPVAVAALDITGLGLLTTNVRFLVAVPPALVAVITTVEVPVVVGVPEITPDAVLTVNPAGRLVAL